MVESRPSCPEYPDFLDLMWLFSLYNLHLSAPSSLARFFLIGPLETRSGNGSLDEYTLVHPVRRDLLPP